MYRNCLFVLALLASGAASCMEESSSQGARICQLKVEDMERSSCIEINPMKKITSWDHVKDFIGRFVAYKATSKYFCPEYCYPLAADSQLAYGYIDELLQVWESKKTGYNMTRLVKQEGRCGNG